MYGTKCAEGHNIAMFSLEFKKATRLTKGKELFIISNCTRIAKNILADRPFVLKTGSRGDDSTREEEAFSGVTGIGGAFRAV